MRQSVYIGETGRAVEERIKEHNRDIRPISDSEASTILEYANETGAFTHLKRQAKFIVREPH